MTEGKEVVITLEILLLCLINSMTLDKMSSMKGMRQEVLVTQF